MANDISPSSKRRKLTPPPQNDNSKQEQEEQEEESSSYDDGDDDDDDLLPGLPNHLAEQCLSLVHPSTLFAVCRSWRRLIYSPHFPPFLSLYTLFSSPLHFQSYDPFSSTWRPLPTLPPSDPPRPLLLRHPSFVSRTLPIQSLSLSGRLLLLAATSSDFSPALPRPLLFHPLPLPRWSFGPPLSHPRRWCAAGSLLGSAFVASGIGSLFSPLVARSVERWNPDENGKSKENSATSSRWERVSDLRDGRFSRDAIDAVGWRGRLCMVNVKGGAMKDGVVYDARRDAWEDMPPGMIAGWRGPAAAMEEDEMYVVDEAEGVLRRYDEGGDTWVVVVGSERLRGAHQITAGGGRVCVVCGGGKGIVVVDVVAEPPRIWEVETPPGLEAVAIHVLPRMSLPVQGQP